MDRKPRDGSAWDTFWAPDRQANTALAGETAAAILDRWWRLEFSAISNLYNIDRNLPIIDLGCGSGVVGAIAKSSFSGLNAFQPYVVSVDRAPFAVRTATAATGGAGIAADFKALPIHDGAASVVISQYGVEYAGPPGLPEAVRIVARDGVFVALLHDSESGLALECQANLVLFEDVIATGIIEAARKEFEVGFALDKGKKARASADDVRAKLKSGMRQFDDILQRQNRTTAMAFIRQVRGDLAVMLARRQAYDPADVFNWLDKIAAELAQSRDRFAAMLRSARTRADLEAFAGGLPAREYEVDPIVKVTMPSGVSLGWRLFVRRR